MINKQELLEEAEKGNAGAQFALGCLYGCHALKFYDKEKAIEWWKKAAAQGYKMAQEALDRLVPRINEAKALKVKTGQGYVYAQYELGMCYDFGKGVERDYKEAVKWYRKAAKEGYVEAQYALGDCYYCGSGVRKNYLKAVDWFWEAAKQGDAEAQYRLGYCYENGKGVKRNKKEATKWYRMAAEQGNVNAKHALY